MKFLRNILKKYIVQLNKYETASYETPLTRKTRLYKKFNLLIKHHIKKTFTIRFLFFIIWKKNIHTFLSWMRCILPEFVSLVRENLTNWICFHEMHRHSPKLYSCKHVLLRNQLWFRKPIAKSNWKTEHLSISNGSRLTFLISKGNFEILFLYCNFCLTLKFSSLKIITNNLIWLSKKWLQK